MDVITRIYYSLNCEYYDGHKYINASQDGEEPKSTSWHDDYTADNDLPLKTTRELINTTKNICNEFLVSAEKSNKLPLPTIWVKMRRLVGAHSIYNEHKGHIDVNQPLGWNGDTDTFRFIYSKTNKLIYQSNIREVLGQDFRYIHADHWRDNESMLDPKTPLCVLDYNEHEVYVLSIKPDMCIVNQNLCQIYPKTTKHIPAKLSDLFNRKTEPVRQASRQKYR